MITQNKLQLNHFTYYKINSHEEYLQLIEHEKNEYDSIDRENVVVIGGFRGEGIYGIDSFSWTKEFGFYIVKETAENLLEMSNNIRKFLGKEI